MMNTSEALLNINQNTNYHASWNNDEYSQQFLPSIFSRKFLETGKQNLYSAAFAVISIISLDCSRHEDVTLNWRRQSVDFASLWMWALRFVTPLCTFLRHISRNSTNLIGLGIYLEGSVKDYLKSDAIWCIELNTLTRK